MYFETAMLNSDVLFTKEDLVIDARQKMTTVLVTNIKSGKFILAF